MRTDKPTFNYTASCLTENKGQDRDYFLFSFDDNTYSLVERKLISCQDEELKLGAKLKIKNGAKVFMGHLVNMGKYPDLLKFSFSL